MTILKEVINDLYQLNAGISLHYIGLKKNPTFDTMLMINKDLGTIIGKLRQLQKEDELNGLRKE